MTDLHAMAVSVVNEFWWARADKEDAVSAVERALSKLQAEHETETKRFHCPIGMTDGSDICSASICYDCLVRHFKAWKQRAEKAEASSTAAIAEVLERAAEFADEAEAWHAADNIRALSPDAGDNVQIAAPSPLGDFADIIAEYDSIVNTRLDPRDPEADFVMRGADWRCIRALLPEADDKVLVPREPKPGLLCGDVAISTYPRYAGWVFVRHVDGVNWTTGAKLTPATWAMLAVAGEKK